MRVGRVFVVVLQVLFVLAGALAGPAAARPQQAPSSRVVLDLPAGYGVAKLFSGFTDEARGVSLVILEMPAVAYEQLAHGMTDTALAKRGIAHVEAAKLERAEPYIFMRGEQSGPQGTVAKFLLAFRESEVTALVTANVQKSSLDSGAVTAAEIERILAGASIAAEPAPARDVFSLRYLGPFQPAGKILGTSRAYTLDGKFEPPKPGTQRPLLIVSPSLDQRTVGDPNALADELFRGLPGAADVEVLERRTSKVADVPAVEIVGTATEKDGSGKVSLYQVLVLPPAGGYYRIVGQVPEADAAHLMPELDKIVRNFRIVE